jgi:SAM-dependent methyltransferase
MSVHHYRQMLDDRKRLALFREAILEAVRPGSAVAEIGTGLGTFAFFALEAGARKIYGIDSDPIIEVAKTVSKDNGLDNRSVFLSGDADKIDLPEKVDFLITEDFHPLFLGPYLESLVIKPRERFLKPGGRMMPISVEVFCAPVTAPRLYQSIAATSNRPDRFCGIDFSFLGELNLNNLHPCTVRPKHLLSDPLPLFTRRLLKLRREDLDLDKKVTFRLRRAETMHGLAAWFDAHLSKHVLISNGPSRPGSAWGQSFLPFRSPVKVRKGDILEVKIRTGRWGSEAIWGWDVRVFETKAGRRARKPKVEFSQSTFKGLPFSKERLQKRSSQFAPNLTQEGKAARFLLERVDGVKSLQELGEELDRKFPGICEGSTSGFQKVLDIVGPHLE